MMMCLRLHAAIIFMLLLQQTATKGVDRTTTMHKGQIEELARVMRDEVREDLQKYLLVSHNKLVAKMKLFVTKTLNYVDKTFEDIRRQLENKIHNFTKHTFNNFQALEEHTKTVILNCSHTLMKNLKSINEQSMKERIDIISWKHQRTEHHEDILKSKVIVCGKRKDHFGKGVVKYNGRDGRYIQDSVSIRLKNETCDTGVCLEPAREENILSPSTGVFTAPMSGEYMFTFSARVDTWTRVGKWLMPPASYVFRKNGKTIKGTQISTNVAPNWKSDKVPVSRTIFLKLQEEDEIDIFQETNSEILDNDVSFCGALLHLDQASTSPGGLFANSDSKIFPSGTLAEQDSWQAKIMVFTSSKEVQFKDDNKKILVGHEEGFKEVLIGEPLQSLGAITSINDSLEEQEIVQIDISGVMEEPEIGSGDKKSVE